MLCVETNGFRGMADKNKFGYGWNHHFDLGFVCIFGIDWRLRTLSLNSNLFESQFEFQQGCLQDYSLRNTFWFFWLATFPSLVNRLAMSIPATEAELLELKKQRYDRQIRVWGAGTVISQMMSSSITLCDSRIDNPLHLKQTHRIAFKTLASSFVV